jgi:ribosomal protein S18 acetylase RimI-like enzyme
LVEGDKTALFDLMGVSERFRGQGIGKALVEAGCRWAQGEGLDLVEVGTQGTNSRVLGMYQKLGFLVVGTQVTLHWLRDR